MRAKSKVANSFTSRNFPRAIRSNCSSWFPLPKTRNGSSPTIFLQLLLPQSESRRRYAGRSSSFIPNGNKPPEFNVANAENKEHNAITSRPHCCLGPSSSGSNAGQNNCLRPQTGITGRLPLQTAQESSFRNYFCVSPKYITIGN